MDVQKITVDEADLQEQEMDFVSRNRVRILKRSSESIWADFYYMVSLSVFVS